MTAGIKSYVSYSNKQKNEFLSKAELATSDLLDKRKLYDAPEYQNLFL